MSNVKTISDDELRDMRDRFAEIKRGPLDPANERDRHAIAGIVPMMVELIDEVLRLRGNAEAPPTALGILDPDYGRIFTIARCVAHQYGYAVGLHGSCTRDLDLLAVPWTASACGAERLAERVAAAAGLSLLGIPSTRPHGRLTWTLMLPGFSEHRWVDLSVASRSEPAASRVAHPDETAVDRFAVAMKAKLAEKRAEGRGGWDDPARCTTAHLAELLRGHIDEGDPVDVGNFAMMLWNRGGLTNEGI